MRAASDSASGALLDLTVLERLLQGDRQQMRKFAGKFVDSTTRDLHEVAAAIAAGDEGQLRHLGHRARSCALTVGATAMATLFHRLEHLPADAAAFSTACQLLAELTETLHLTIDSLRESGL